MSLVKKELKTVKKILSVDNPASSEREVEDEEDQNSSNVWMQKISWKMLKSMNQTNLAKTLKSGKNSGFGFRGRTLIHTYHTSHIKLNAFTG